jgi:hypothetical protein
MANKNALTLRVVPWGPTPAEVGTFLTTLNAARPVAARLGGPRRRLLRVRLLEKEKEEQGARPAPPSRFRATAYDYENNRAVGVEGEFGETAGVEIAETGRQPLPTRGEFAAAVQVLEKHPQFGPALMQGELRPYRPMPPLASEEQPDGRVERTLGVGLASKTASPHHRIVGVNLVSETVVEEVPEAPSPSESHCGPPVEGDCGDTGTTGQVRVTVRKGNDVLWTFVVVRPAASSGTNGSGVELRHVHYRGKQVLYRAHVPILNVEYFEDGINAGCGPVYRDWQNSENCFEAEGADVIPGYRLAAKPAKTIIESGSDAGNFHGVAIYVEGQEVVLVSEMQAGWYRYVSYWRFHANGTIRPRFGFAATDNPCTCAKHHHHVYWRLDFDIKTAGGNVVEEFNDPPLPLKPKWTRHDFEIRRSRNPARKRKWRVRNDKTDQAYVLTPGAHDGQASAFGVGDLWALRYRGTELDDGQGFTTDPALAKAQLDKFLKAAESIVRQDVVLWYAAHFVHDEQHEEGSSHVVGPDLTPSKW